MRADDDVQKALASTRKEQQEKIEVKVPDNIRRKMLGSRIYKLERDGD